MPRRVGRSLMSGGEAVALEPPTVGEASSFGGAFVTAGRSSSAASRHVGRNRSGVSVQNFQPMQSPALITGDKAIGPNGDKRRNRSVDFKSSDFGTAGHVPHSDRPICGT
jgi:hypothetical protein